MTIICIACKGTGFIEAESVDLGRPQIVNGRISYPDIKGHGDWQKIPCFCLEKGDVSNVGSEERSDTPA